MTDIAPQLSWEEAVLSLNGRPELGEFVRACFYDDPLIEAARRYHASSEWAAIRPLLPPVPGRALDIGAGRGISSFALASDGWQVSALEPDPSDRVGAGAIRALAAEAHLPIEVVQEWGESLPFADASFDLVSCRAVLHHARDLGDLCKEIARVLKPGGRFIGVREHVITDAGELPAFLAMHPLHRLYGGEHAYTRAEYRGAIEGAGLAIAHEFNPFESDINLYPNSRAKMKRAVARKFGATALAPLVPGWLLTLRGARNRTPGRLHSFVADKPEGAARGD